ncbi:glycosyltransferase [Neolewinella antarctica]|uniref:Glycosyltransferase involved in cell wall biosynthesis n=1 Tax=Neolewinella antarctica TaxID=442734 RepID=A0ABX0XHV9_9BACT|nr:glycosyltransferase [Neolewinella antarctica]NJC28474.1 glycosyltransferase involved in cell wall biosynthesis [Neolewinella antarctica]
MRLLVISAWYPNRVYPADGNFVQNLAELVADDWEVTVLAVTSDFREPTGYQRLEKKREGPLNVVRIYYSGAGPRVQRILARRNAWRRGVSTFRDGFDLIHAHVLVDGGIVAAKLARKWGIPFVVTEHASRWLAPWPLLRVMERYLATRAASSADLIMPVSPGLRAGMERHGIKGKYQVVSNSVDETTFYPPPGVVGITNVQVFTRQ